MEEATPAPAPEVKTKSPRAAPRVGRARPAKAATNESANPKPDAAAHPKSALRPYYEAVGRRKEAIARVRLSHGGQATVTVDHKPFELRFGSQELRDMILAPLRSVGQEGMVSVSAHVSGGGVVGQAAAIRLGIARALLKLNPIFRKALKKEGHLMRDARVKERKKYGLKRARRAPQFSKR